MGLKKGTTTTAAPAAQVAAPSAVDSGVAAATSRLKKSTEAAVEKKAVSTGSRDYNEEARGKTRCALYAAALMSPALAGAKWDSVEELFTLVRKAADDGTAYTFGN